MSKPRLYRNAARVKRQQPAFDEQADPFDVAPDWWLEHPPIDADEYQMEQIASAQGPHIQEDRP